MMASSKLLLEQSVAGCGNLDLSALQLCIDLCNFIGHALGEVRILDRNANTVVGGIEVQICPAG